MSSLSLDPGENLEGRREGVVTAVRQEKNGACEGLFGMNTKNSLGATRKDQVYEESLLGNLVGGGEPLHLERV